MHKKTTRTADECFNDIRTAHKELWRAIRELEHLGYFDSAPRLRRDCDRVLDWLYSLESYLVDLIYFVDGDGEVLKKSRDKHGSSGGGDS